MIQIVNQNPTIKIFNKISFKEKLIDTRIFNFDIDNQYSVATAYSNRNISPNQVTFFENYLYNESFTTLMSTV